MKCPHCNKEINRDQGVIEAIMKSYTRKFPDKFRDKQGVWQISYVVYTRKKLATMTIEEISDYFEMYHHCELTADYDLEEIKDVKKEIKTGWY